MPSPFAVRALPLLALAMGPSLVLRRPAQAPRVLGLLAALLLLAHLMDAWWLVAPAFRTGGVTLAATDPLAVVGLGGLWLAAFLRSAIAVRESRPRAAPGEPLPDHG